MRGGGLTGIFIEDAVDALPAAAAATAAGGGAKFKVTNPLDPEFTVDQCEPPLPSAILRLTRLKAEGISLLISISGLALAICK